VTALAVGSGEDVDGLEQLPTRYEGIRDAQRRGNVSLRAAEAEGHVSNHTLAKLAHGRLLFVALANPRRLHPPSWRAPVP
jgi:hypothetical protein